MKQTLISALFLIACAAIMIGGGLMSADPQALQALLTKSSTQSASE